MIVRDWLAAAADEKPQQGFFSYFREGQRKQTYFGYSFGVTNELVATYAAQIAAQSIVKGSVVGLLMKNSRKMVLLLLALMRLECVAVPLNTRLTEQELRKQLERASVEFLFCDEEHAQTASQLNSVAWRIFVYASESMYEHVLPINVNLSAVDVQQYKDGQYNLNRAAVILFTSGTSGQPKAAQLTLANFLANARASAVRIGTFPTDNWLVSLPLYHVGGLAILFRSVSYKTRFLLLRNDVPSHEALVDALSTTSTTLVSLVPTQLFRLLEQGFTPNPNLRLILLGGAAASPDLLRRCCELGLPVATTYGLTEATSQVATMLPADACRKPGSVGKPLDGVQVSIVDDEGQPLPANTPGQIVVRGETVMRGYLDAPGDQTLREGGLHTGDIGYLDNDGDLWVLQRRSDLIVSGGENVYPAEVEAVLRQHPAIADACVVGIPDAEWGQRVAAAVVLKPDAVFDQADVVAFTAERLAGYKRPRVFRALDALPLTASGKIARREVQEMMRSTSDGQE